MSKTVLNCGYVPLVDCAPLVIAKELGFAAEEGVALNLVRQPSWSALRDMLALGHLDAAQMLSPMPVAMSIGLGGLPARVDTLMVLSVNGTVFGVSNDVAADIGPVPFGDANALLAALSARKGKPLRIGVPFHYSMHRLLLSYWTSTAPDVQIEEITVPPPRMADAVAEGFVDAFWVGEPWGSVAVGQDVARLMMTGRDVWQFAPEKVLAARHDWVEANADAVGRLMRAVFKASAWLDVQKNKPLAVEILARSEHLSMSPDLIDPALSGDIIAQAEYCPAGDRPLFAVSSTRGHISLAQSGGMDREPTWCGCCRYRAGQNLFSIRPLSSTPVRDRGGYAQCVRKRRRGAAA